MATPMLPDESPRGLNLASVIETVRRRRFLALLPLVLVLAAVTTLAFFLPSLWTARATVLVNGQQIPEAYVRSSVSSGDVEARLLTLTHQILDGPRLTKIIEQYNLYPAMRQTHPPADVVERMRRDIRVEIPEERERRNREARWLVFTVAYATTDRTVAVDVTNTLAALFDEENRRTTEQQAVGTSEFLETQLKELRTRLAGQEQKITAYKEQHLGELPEQREVNLRTIERLQLQLSIASENNRRAGERRQLINQSLNDLDVASAMAGSGGTGATGLGETPAAARLAALRQELTALQTTYSDKYPDVISTKEQIRLLEVRVAQEDKKLAAAQAAAAASPKSGTAAESGQPRSPPGRHEPIRPEPHAAARPGFGGDQGRIRGDRRPPASAGRLRAPARGDAQARGRAGHDHPRLRDDPRHVPLAAGQARRGRHRGQSRAGQEGRDLPHHRTRPAAGSAHGSQPDAPAAGRSGRWPSAPPAPRWCWPSRWTPPTAAPTKSVTPLACPCSPPSHGS